MNKPIYSQKRIFGKYVALIVCVLLVGILFAGTVHSKDPKRDGDNKSELLYYDKSSGVKIVNKNGFLLKVEKNEKGLRIVEELGPYPGAYPDHLPEPKAHVENSSD